MNNLLSQALTYRRQGQFIVVCVDWAMAERLCDTVTRCRKTSGEARDSSSLKEFDDKETEVLFVVNTAYARQAHTVIHMKPTRSRGVMQRSVDMVAPNGMLLDVSGDFNQHDFHCDVIHLRGTP